jgi:hypothetical protein
MDLAERLIPTDTFLAMQSRKSQDSVPVSAQKLSAAYLKKPAHSSAVIHPFLEHILQPDAFRGSIFGTTLINKKDPAEKSLHQHAPIVHLRGAKERKTSRLQEKLMRFCALPGAHVALLPCYAPWDTTITDFLPTALLLKNNMRKNIYLISKSSFFTFFDIEENFFVCPQNMPERTTLLEVAQQVLWKFYHACLTKTLGLSAAFFAALRLSHKLSPAYIVEQKKLLHKNITERLGQDSDYRWLIDDGISCGWIAVGDYALHETLPKFIPETKRIALKQEALHNGIRFLYNTAINLAWLEINPEAFLSERIRSPEKEQKLRETLEPVIQELKMQSKKTGKPLPKLFVGVELTGNFGPSPAPHPVVDLFGTVYPNIPSPLDISEFWEKELLSVFDLFCDMFEKIMPITGIFIDFEMYHAVKQAALYNDLMDYSDCAWQAYCTAKNSPNLTKLKTHAQRITYLLENKKLKNYMQDLENKACELGKTIKNRLRARMPHVQFGAYAPTLPASWFYRGILQGLSSPTEPVVFTSFNVDAYSHKNYLEKKNIYAFYGAPILLSKFKTLDDF